MEAKFTSPFHNIGLSYCTGFHRRVVGVRPTFRTSRHWQRSQMADTRCYLFPRQTKSTYYVTSSERRSSFPYTQSTLPSQSSIDWTERLQHFYLARPGL